MPIDKHDGTVVTEHGESAADRCDHGARRTPLSPSGLTALLLHEGGRRLRAAGGTQPPKFEKRAFKTILRRVRQL